MKILQTLILLLLTLLFVDNLKAQETIDTIYVDYIRVEHMPVYSDRSTCFLEYLNQNFHYSGRDTTIFFSFIVTENGKVENFELYRSDNLKLADKLESVIRNSSTWTPGMQSGRNVRVRLSYKVKLPGFINLNLNEYFDLGDSFFEKGDFNNANKYYKTPLELNESYTEFGRKYYEIAMKFYQINDRDSYCFYLSVTMDCKDESSKSLAKKKFKKTCK